MSGETYLARCLVELFGDRAADMAQTYATHQAWTGNQAGLERWRRVLTLVARRETHAASPEPAHGQASPQRQG